MSGYSQHYGGAQYYGAAPYGNPQVQGQQHAAPAAAASQYPHSGQSPAAQDQQMYQPTPQGAGCREYEDDVETGSWHDNNPNADVERQSQSKPRKHKFTTEYVREIRKGRVGSSKSTSAGHSRKSHRKRAEKELTQFDQNYYASNSAVAAVDQHHQQQRQQQQQQQQQQQTLDEQAYYSSASGSWSTPYAPPSNYPHDSYGGSQGWQ